MTAEATVTGDVIDQRLDALDRALLGLLPRAERLAMVADVEARVREGHAADPAAVERLASPGAESTAEASTSRGPRQAQRRSTLALTSGVIGIVALVLLFLMPVTYLVVATTSEVIGEVTSYLLLSANVIVVALGGAAAVVMGITALVRLSRRQGRVGHGWAITALCTGPLPALVGGLATITVAVPMMAEVAGNYGQSSGSMYVSGEGCNVCVPSDFVVPAVSGSPPLVAAAPASGYGTSAGSYEAPAANSPAPGSTAPSYQSAGTPVPLAPVNSAYAAPATDAPLAPLPASSEGTAPAAEAATTDPTTAVNPAPVTAGPEDAVR